jgi:hypothetical protein
MINSDKPTGSEDAPEKREGVVITLFPETGRPFHALPARLPGAVLVNRTKFFLS